MKALKRFTAVVASLALTVGMCVSVFAGSTWGDYIGFDGKPGHTWYEAADGKFTQNSDTSWTCKMKTIVGVVSGDARYSRMQKRATAS